MSAMDFQSPEALQDPLQLSPFWRCNILHLTLQLSAITLCNKYLDSYRGDDSELQRLAGPEYYEQLLYHAFDLLENNRELLRSLASDSMLWSIGEVIRNSVHDELLTHLQRDQAAGQTLAADPQLLTEFIIGAIEEVIRWWFSSSDPIPTEELKKQLVNSVLRLVS